MKTGRSNPNAFTSTRQPMHDRAAAARANKGKTPWRKYHVFARIRSKQPEK